MNPLPADIDCVDLVEMVTAYDEGALPPAEHARIEAHLRGCDGCAEFVRQMRAVPTAVAQAGVEALPDGVRGGLIDAYRSWRNEG